MELIECLFALANMRIYQIRDVMCTCRKRLTTAIHDSLTPYQQTIITTQINELQRHRLRQFRLLDFLFGLSETKLYESTTLPVYLYTSHIRTNDISVDESSSNFPPSNDSSTDTPPNMADQYVMFKYPHHEIAYYRPEYVLHLLTKSILLGRRHRRRFLLPYRMFYSNDEDDVFMFLPLQEYIVLLPLETIIENFAIVHYHLFEHVFCFLVKDLLDMLALFHEHGITLNGDLSHLCVDRLSGRIKLNLCTYSVPIPYSYYAGIEEDLHAVVNLIFRYTTDSTLYAIPEVREQLLQIAYSIQQTITRDHSYQFLLIPNPVDVVKCLAQSPVFYSNAYPPIAIISTDIVEVFATAQKLIKEMQIASVDDDADSLYPLAGSTPRTDISSTHFPDSQFDLENWFPVISHRSLPPISNTLSRASPTITPTKWSYEQGRESVEIEHMDEASLGINSSSSIAESLPEARLNLELKVELSPPVFSSPVRISNRYVHSLRTRERLRQRAIDDKQIERVEDSYDIICCTKSRCLSPTKLFPAIIPKFPLSAMSVLQEQTPKPKLLRATSQPALFNTITTLQIVGPYTSSMNQSHASVSNHTSKGRRTSFGGSALTAKTSHSKIRSSSQPDASMAPVSKAIYILDIDNTLVTRKPVQPLQLKQHVPEKPKPKDDVQAKSITGLTTVVPPAFPAGPKRISRRHSYSIVPPISQAEVTESISKALSANMVQRSDNPVSASRPSHMRSFSAQPRVHDMKDVEEHDVIYSRVTLHAPNFAKPVRRVLIERNLNFATVVSKIAKDTNPIEELNQALVNYW